MSIKSNTKKIITVLGAGNMGTAVAQVLADNGHEVRIWNWEGDLLPLKQIEKFGENKKYLKGVKLSKNIIPKYKINDALDGAHVVFLVVPSDALEHTISFAARSIENNAVIVDVSKGVEPENLRLIPHIIMKHVRPKLRKNVTTISGPAVAGQMVKKHFTAMNVASKNRRAIARVREVMENDYIRLVPTNDVIGVEVGGSFKNVYSIAIGMCDGLGFGLNTKAALLTYALREISDLIYAMGGKRQTAYNLAGIGDLIGTSLCEDSRNRILGEFLGKGHTSSQALKKIKQTTEGVAAARCLVRLVRKYHVHAPFAHVIYHCVTSNHDPRRAFKDFLQKLD
ncbi:NAD(P)H-dependent glycerol-3-phosphate dehydrogenase [Candidatus Parcubacteria bacterium]|jgi:glycerol-3-phosphate dehydrogenase (NAD(P)+)|nr:NAD(P)H-dependent glycerol-3-phosphate dehydrogenase [Candidatus Parcubacteria bacterium]MBT3948818.1 NAD(P)H-dependent glycerol-3-phosphate dehydrogenase [Candidatus Parcubacteria bacterium]